MDEKVHDSEWFGFAEFLKQPFKTQGSALNWLLFVGLLLVAVWFWQWILIKLASGMSDLAE